MNISTLETEYEQAKDSPGLLLWQLTNKWQAEQRAALKPFSLTHVQFVLLATLTYANDRYEFSQKQLAHHAQTDEMMTSQVLRKLEKMELIKRQPSKVDRRAVIITPTSAGIALANRAVKKVEATDKAFFSVIENDLPGFIKLMRQLAR